MKKLKILLLTCIMIITIIGVSYGAISNYKVTMETPKQDILAGETIQVALNIKDINLEHGIVAFSSILSYDEKVFKEPEIVGGENWGTPIKVENLIQCTTSTLEPVKEDQEAIILTFKVKETAHSGDTKISLSKLEASDGENTIINSGTSITLNISNPDMDMAEFIVDSIWFTPRNIVIAGIIGVVTLIITVLLIIYYTQHREEKE